MKKSLLLYLFLSLILLTGNQQYISGQTYHNLSGGSLTQDWTNTDLITVSDDWSGIPSIRGFRGDDGTAATGTDPQTIIADLNSVVDINANQTDPSAFTTGGVTEFHITNPVVGLAGSGTADAPNLVLFINTTGCSNVKIKYDLRDIDASTDDAVQAMALQYRVGGTGNFTNIPAGFVADASSGPGLAILVTHVEVLLPSACFNQADVQLRIITSNAAGNDEYIGIDNIVVEVDATAPAATFNPASAAVNVPVNITPTITFDEPVRKTDGNELVNADLVPPLITFKKTDGSGMNVPFSAVIDAAKRVITVTPSSVLDNSQVYYLAIGALEDAGGIESTLKSVSFTTISASAATVTVTGPVGGEIFHAGDPATITWTSSNITNVKVEVWVRQGATTWDWTTLVPSMPAIAGKLDLTIPADAGYGTQYKIRVSDAGNATVNSVSPNFTIIAVATTITDLRSRCIKDDIVLLNGEVIMTFKRATSNQKYIQDASRGLLIYDPSAVLTTTLSEGDKFTGLEGKLDLYGGLLEIIPVKSTVTVKSSGNTVTIPEMTVTQYNASFILYESMLIKLSDVVFPAGNGTNTFSANTNYTITDGTTNITFRTFASGESNIIGSVIPASHVSLKCLAGFFNTTIQVYGLTTSDFGQPTGIGELLPDDITIYPVPAGSELNIRNIRNVRGVEVLDLTGRMVISVINSNDDEMQIPLNELNKGMYFIRFSTNAGNVIRRFIKQ